MKDIVAKGMKMNGYMTVATINIEDQAVIVRKLSARILAIKDITAGPKNNKK